MLQKKLAAALCALALSSLLISGCATSNLIEWSKGEPSQFDAPQPHQDVFVRSAGTVLAFPVALAWDVVTFPFQLIWGSYPYGTDKSPDGYEQ